MNKEKVMKKLSMVFATKNDVQTRAKRMLVIAMLALTSFAFPAEVYATLCNEVGCFGAKVRLVRVDSNQRIWFVVNDSSVLQNLNPVDGCILKNIWTGQAEPALYIRPDDPNRDEKYTMLLKAFATGTNIVIGFGPVLDPATGWCSLSSLDVTDGLFTSASPSLCVEGIELDSATTEVDPK